MSPSSVRNYNNGHKKLSQKVSLEDVACEQVSFESERGKKNPHSSLLE